jgi:hypothetical protein
MCLSLIIFNTIITLKIQYKVLIAALKQSYQGSRGFSLRSEKCTGARTQSCNALKWGTGHLCLGVEIGPGEVGCTVAHGRHAQQQLLQLLLLLQRNVW